MEYIKTFEQFINENRLNEASEYQSEIKSLTKEVEKIKKKLDKILDLSLPVNKLDKILDQIIVLELAMDNDGDADYIGPDELEENDIENLEEWKEDVLDLIYGELDYNLKNAIKYLNANKDNSKFKDYRSLQKAKWMHGSTSEEDGYIRIKNVIDLAKKIK